MRLKIYIICGIYIPHFGNLDGDGGADLAATVRIRNGWMKFRELLPFLTSRARVEALKSRDADD